MRSAQNIELSIGNYVEFDRTGFTIIGKIKEFVDGKCEIIPMGFRYKYEEEIEEFKKKLKKSYKMDPRKCWVMEKRNK